ncbi:MAG TPA: hypothetical protein VJL34_01560, partial [Anaerolineales bacterium]|nr:hypothetical protein [Anaerolineales bacterium]
GISEAVAIYLAAVALLLWAGVAWGRLAGLFIALAAMTISMAAQTAWLWQRSRPVMQRVRQRDARDTAQRVAGAMIE